MVNKQCTLGFNIYKKEMSSERKSKRKTNQADEQKAASHEGEKRQRGKTN